MGGKKSKIGKHEAGISAQDRDELRMQRSGAAESGYHPPSEQDLNDLRKDHSTASGPGLLNADEGVRRDGNELPGPIDSLSGEVGEESEEEQKDRRSA